MHILNFGYADWRGNQYDTFCKTTESIAYNRGILARRFTNQNSGKVITVFCAQHTEDFIPNSVNTGIAFVPTDEKVKKACKIAYLGWYKKYNNLVFTMEEFEDPGNYVMQKDYEFTQQLIWEALEQSNARFINENIQKEYEQFKSNIFKRLEEIEQKPSFNEKTINLDAGVEKIITDENNILKEYSSIDKEVNGVRLVHNLGENTLKIKSQENRNIKQINLSEDVLKNLGLIKEETKNNNTSIYFEFSSGVQNQIYSLNYNSPVSLSLNLQITQYGNLELKKVNNEGNLIDGAIFEITGPESYKKEVTVKNGIIKLERLKIGTYTIKEKTAPYGYLLDTKSYNIEVKTNQTTTQAIVNNEPTGTIQVVKKSTQGDLIKDTIFKVTACEEIKNAAGTKTYYTKGQIVANIKTDSKGLAKISNLPLGKYVVEETKAEAGYLLDLTKHNITLSYKGQTEKIVLESFEKVDTTPTGEIKVYKTDKLNNKLKGAQISLYAREDIRNVAGTKIWYKKGNLIAKTITNEKGEAVFSNLHLGHYYVKETNAPDGYLLNTKEFDVELKYKDQTTKVVYLDVSSLINEEPKGTITIIKKDSKTGSVPQGDAIFKGAVYKVYAKEDIYNKAKTKKFYSKGDLVATRTIDENGRTEDIKDLPLGEYVVKEETASLGYMIDNKEYEVNLLYKNQNTKVISNITTSLEKVKEMGVHIFKTCIENNSIENSGLEGAEFTIKLNSAVERAYKQGYAYAEVWNGIDENGNKVNVDIKRVAQAQAIAKTYEVIKTDSEGNAYTKKLLPYGKYIVKETEAPLGYKSTVDFTFLITDDENEIEEIAKKTKHLVINNVQLGTYIKLIKKDLKTEKLVTLNSTTFEIKAVEDIYDRASNELIFKKGEVISQKIGNTTYTSFTTNADNIIIPDNSYYSKNDNKSEVTTPLKLPIGSYEIIEKKVPDGFLQLDKAVTFEIKDVKDYNTDKDGEFVKEIVIKNEQPTATIKLNKTIAIRDDVDTSLIDISDLSGIEFILLAKEDIIDKRDGSKIYKKGQEIKKYNLTKDGKLTITDLPIGGYEIVETKTLEGLVLNKLKYEIKFEQKDLTTKVYVEKLNISNDTSVVEFSKADVTGDKELKGAKLSVLDSENNVIDEWTSTDKTHKIEGLKIGKEYMLKEEIAPDGYVKATSVKFTIDDTNKIQKVNMIDKIVLISKTDITNVEELEGAELEVIDEDGNVVDKWISTKEPHKVKGLEEGKTYILKEITAPYGYKITEEIKFDVTTDKDTQKIEMKDMQILKNVKLVKKDFETKEIIKENFTFGIYEDLECLKLIKEIKSNKDEGTILFDNLKYGTYYIKEIEEPTGYLISNEIIKFEVNDKGIFVNEKQVEEKDGVCSIEFLNNKIPVIETTTKIQTSDELNIGLWTTCLVISFVAAVIIVSLVIKDKNKQKIYIGKIKSNKYNKKIF